MPNLVALAARGASGRMSTTTDAVTESALRAALTGRERVSLLGFVRNLWPGTSAATSILTQLAAAGAPVLVVGDGSMFGVSGPAVQHAPNRLGTGTCLQTQGRALQRALGRFLDQRRGQAGLVLVHVTCTDTIAHAPGPGTGEYDATFARVDDWIGRLGHAIDATDSLAVIGDHGHDLEGRHLPGMAVPTVAVFTGPAFRAGSQLGGIRIQAVRGLMSRALGVEVPASDDSPIALGWVVLLTLAVVAVCVGWTVIAAGPRLARAVALPLLLCVGWGAAFAATRSLIHWPSHRTVVVFWLAVAAASIPASLRWGAQRVSRVLVVVVVFVLPPTVYRYGAPSAMAPVWGIALLLLLIGAWRKAESPASAALAALAALAAFVLLCPFLLTDAVNFHFRAWAGPGAELLGSAGGRPSVPLLASLLSLAAKGLVFVPWGGRRWELVFGGLVVLVLHAGQTVAHFGPLELAASALLLAAALVRPTPVARRIALLGAGYLVLLYTLRVPIEAFIELDCLMAALILTARLSPDPVLRTVLGVLVIGWIGLEWTFHDLEWAFVYDWLDPATAERWSAVLVLPILARFLLLGVVVRVACRLRPAPPGLLGLKVSSVLLMTLGVALYDPTTLAIPDSGQQAAVWLLASLPLMGPRAIPEA